jgi:PAS domain S-box-containing protein
MKEKIKILLVEDMPADAELNIREVQKVLDNCEFMVVEREDDYLNALENFNPHLILSDYTLPEFDGLSALRLAIEKAPDVPVIMVTGSINEDTAVECMKAGAVNYVIKQSIKRLGSAILHALEERQRKIDYHKAQSDLIESEKRYRSLFELSPVGIIVQDAESNIVHVNDTYCVISGFSRSEILGKNVGFLAGAQISESIIDNRRRILSGEILKHEVVNVRKDGSEMIIELSESAFTLNDGSIGILSIAADITERKKNEEELKKQNDFQQRLIDAIPLPVFYKDMNGLYQGCNIAFAELMGKNKTQIIGETVFDVQHNNYAEIYHAADLRLLETGGVQTFEAPVVTKTGSIREMIFHKATYPDADGSNAGIIGSMTDITDRKAIENNLIEKNRELQFLSEYALSLTSVGSDSDLVKLMVDEIKKYSGAVLASFSAYKSHENLLALECVSTDIENFDELVTGIINDGTFTFFPADINLVKRLLDDSIVINTSLNELTNGKISPEHESLFIELTGISHMAAISLNLSDELYGTVVLGFGKDQKSPELELLKSYSYISSVAVRRKRAEDGLKEREERLRKVVDSAQDAMIIIDENAKVVIWNLSAERMFGYTFSEVEGKELHKLIAPEKYQKEYIKGFAAFSKSGAGRAVGVTQELEAIRKDGVTIPVEMALSSMKIENSWFSISAIRDISERKKSQEEIISSEKRYRELFDANRDALAVIGLKEDGKLIQLLEVNDAGAEMLGFSKVEMQNIPIGRLEEGLTKRMIYERKKELISGHNLTFETRLVHRSGKRVSVEITLNMVNYDGKPAVLLIAHDISERKYKESLQKLQYNIATAALNASGLQELYEAVRNELSALLDTSNFYIAFINEKTGLMHSPFEKDEKVLIPDWPAARSLSGRVLKQGKSLMFTKKQISELAGSGEIDLIGEQSEIWLGAPIFKEKKCIGLIAVQNYENEFAFNDDSRYIMELAAHELGNYIGRKEAEETNLKLSRAVEQNPIGIMITTNNGIIQYVNPKFCEMSGFSLSEVIGKKPSIVKSGYHDASFYADLWHTIKSGKNWYGDLRNRKKDGTLYWESMIISPLVDKNGKVLNFIAVREDITGKKQMIEELKNAKDKAEESDRLKTAFLQNISHEIRTPLNGILGFSELLIQDWTTPDDRIEYNDAIQHSGKRLMEIVSNILDISIIEAGQMLITPERFNVNSFIIELYNFYQGQASLKNLNLRYEFGLPSENAYLTADTTRLYQVLNNLLNNALKFTKTGEIVIGYKVENESLLFFVKDTGIGISGEHFARIFDRFYQVEQSSTRTYEGAGLGLAISEGLVLAMGGKIWLESEKDKGTVFFFSLPAGDLTSISNIVSENEAPTVNDVILIAEDDDTSYRLLITSLKKFNVVVLRAFNGKEAVELVINHKKIALILMDIKMPVMDGLEATKLIKKIRPELPIIAQTAYAYNEDIEKAKEAGCDDHLSKPILAAKLNKILVKYLNRQPE